MNWNPVVSNISTFPSLPTRTKCLFQFPILSPILIGFGNPTAKMQPGDDLTLNWCNPAKRRIMINDQKVAGIVIDILG